MENEPKVFKCSVNIPFSYTPRIIAPLKETDKNTKIIISSDLNGISNLDLDHNKEKYFENE